MARLWIVHREARWREALRRVAGEADVLAIDPAQAAAAAEQPVPRVVLLGVAGDFEAELEWTHRLASRAASASAPAPAWVGLAAPGDLADARRLFDALPIEWVPLAGATAELRGRLREALAARRPVAALTDRRRRDAATARFTRWLGDLPLPELLPLLDPARDELALLVRGEAGTGRGLVARYVHAMAAGGPPGPFAAIAASPQRDARSLLAGLVAGASPASAAGVATLCVEEVDRLAPELQRELLGWVELGLPGGAAARVRWMATAGEATFEDRLDPDLASALAGVEIRLPPLRERPEAIARIAQETARPRHLGADALAALAAHPWLGNARELEAAVRRALARSGADPLGAADLVFDALWFPPAEEPNEAPAPKATYEEGRQWDQSPIASEATPFDRGALASGAAEGRGARSEPQASGVDSRGALQQSTALPQQPERPQAAAGLLEQAAPSGADPSLRRLASAVAHEVGNPLVGIRTFTQMLPSRFDDPEFRRQFSERVEADTRRIEAVVETLARIGSLPPPERQPVDVSALLARLLQLQRGRIQERRLVVLEELERDQPRVPADAEQLRFAFGLLLEEALAWIPDRGDLYVATRHQPATADAGARLRVLLRSRGVTGAGVDAQGLGPADHALAVAAVEAVVRAHGGQLAVEAADPGETLVLIDLPA